MNTKRMTKETAKKVSKNIVYGCSNCQATEGYTVVGELPGTDNLNELLESGKLLMAVNRSKVSCDHCGQMGVVMTQVFEDKG